MPLPYQDENTITFTYFMILGIIKSWQPLPRPTEHDRSYMPGSHVIQRIQPVRLVYTIHLGHCVKDEEQAFGDRKGYC